MKKFFNVKVQEMTVGQTFLFLLLYMIFFAIVWIAMFMVPQHAEEIWDTVESWFDRVKEKFFHKKSEVEEFEDDFEI